MELEDKTGYRDWKIRKLDDAIKGRYAKIHKLDMKSGCLFLVDNSIKRKYLEKTLITLLLNMEVVMLHTSTLMKKIQVMT